MALKALFYPDVPFDSLFIPYIYKEIYFEGVYVDVLNQKKDMVIVDVGANIGVTVQHFKDYASKVYAIEPSPEHFEALSKNVEFNGWDNVAAFNMALDDKEGEADFVQNDGNRTMNTLADTGVMRQFGKNGYRTSVKVKTTTIDKFFSDNQIEKVDFMKLDPEGAEERIILSDGFLKVYDKISAMMVEFHLPGWEERIMPYMEKLGFKARRYEASAVIVLFTRG